MRAFRSRGLVTLLTALGLAVPVVALSASTAPASAAVNDPVVSGDTSPMWQTNNNVEAIAVSDGIVYAGGTFTRVRPPGAAAGTNETVRNYLAAFNANTGALITGFNLNLNGRVNDLAVSPDGNRLYLAGTFTSVNGTARQRVAAVNIPSGTLVSSFTANANRGVTAIEATGSTVYVSGYFDTIRGTSRPFIASLDADTGAVNTAFDTELVAPPPTPFWSTNPSAAALSIEMAPDGSRLLVGGGFQTVNGELTGGMVSLDPVSGDLEQWDANLTQPTNTNCSGRITDIVTQGDMAYVTGEGDPPGCFEGTYAARIGDGQLEWVSSCLGASLGLTIMDDVLYKASHQHDCAFTPGDARGGYVGGTARDTFIWYRLVAQNLDDGSFQHWAPNTNAVTGSNPVGPQVISNDGNQVFVGGDFTRVNGQLQQGIARFGRTSNAAPLRPEAPTVLSTGVGQATITWPAVYDPDDGTLTYNLYRGSNLISSQTVESYPWSRPTMRYDDSGRPPGSTASYYLRVTDGTATTAASTSTSVTYRTTPPDSYAGAVAALDPTFHWDMAGTGTGVNDASGNGRGGQLIAGASRGPGALSGNGGADLDGSSGYVTSNDLQALSPSFTQSLWVRGTTIAGGSLMAVTDARTGDGTYSDRALTMDNNGNIVFSVHQEAREGSPDPFGPRLNNVRLQGPIYNDGRWHHVVATWDDTTGTAALYIDGFLNGTYVGTAGGLTEGYYRVGYTDLAREQAVFGRNYYDLTWPGSEYFDGGVDEVAVFPTALTQAQVQELFAAGVNDGTGAPEPVPPTASFTASTDGLTVTVDATGSTDPDGTIQAYEWSFGDGTTATGPQTSHTYAAADDYTVTLTVTDDSGLTDQATRQVTATEPPPPPPPGETTQTTVVENETGWRWRYEGTAPPAGWTGTALNDSSWNLGNAILGWGTPVSTSLDIYPNTSDRPRTAHFRRSFQLDDASTATGLQLTTVANDGVVVYVNGTEVGRSNMPDGTITHLTFASSARNVTTANNNPVVIDVPANLLVDGTNVIAAETHLNYRNTRDVTFDLRAVLTHTG